jgi:hypothetical protein
VSAGIDAPAAVSHVHAVEMPVTCTVVRLAPRSGMLLENHVQYYHDTPFICFTPGYRACTAGTGTTACSGSTMYNHAFGTTCPCVAY